MVTCSAGSSTPCFGCVFSAHQTWVLRVCTPPASVCAEQELFCRDFTVFLRVWTRIVCVEVFSYMGSDEGDENPWLDLREWGQQPVLEGKLQPFQCKWAQDEHSALCIAGCKNWVCTNMRNSLAAELNCLGGKRLLWRWHLCWKVVIKLLLRTVKDFSFLFACCTKQQQKLK